VRERRSSNVVKLSAIATVSQATSVKKEHRKALEQEIESAVAYAHDVLRRQAARSADPGIKRSMNGIGKAAATLLEKLDEAGPGARVEVERVVGEFALFKGNVRGLTSDLRPKLRSASRWRTTHRLTFLRKLDRAIERAGGKHPTYDKNRDSGTWRKIIDALSDALPPGFLAASPSTLADWTKKVALTRENRRKAVHS
jgi:hypothetical protein